VRFACHSYLICRLIGAHFASVTLDYGQIVGYVHRFSASEVRSMTPERLLHRSVHAVDGYTRLVSMPCFVSHMVQYSTITGFSRVTPSKEWLRCTNNNP
jgi:hypothetical protein